MEESTDVLEAHVKQQLEYAISIKEIKDILSTSYTVNISPVFCSSLLVPIVQHAIRTRQDLHNLSNDYSHTIAQLHSYICCQPIPQYTRIINDSTLLIHDIIKSYKRKIIYQNYPFALSDLSTDTQLELLNIMINACRLMIDDKKTTLFGAYTGRLWNDLPHIFEASIYHTPTPRTFIIYSAQDLLHAYIRTGYDPEDDFSLENLLMSIMRVLKHSIEAKADSETVVKLLHCVNEVLGWLNSLLQFIASNRDQYAPLEVLCVKANVLVERAETMLNGHAQVDIDFMDVDQDELRPQVYDVRCIAKHSSVYKQLYGMVSHTVEALAALEDDNDRRASLLIQKLKDIASCLNTSTSSLLKPHCKSLSELLVRALLYDTGFAGQIAGLFDCDTTSFLRAYFEYTLPYAVLYAPNENPLAIISKELSVSMAELCLQGGLHITIALLMEQNSKLKEQGIKRLTRVSKSKAIFKTLISNNLTQITTDLALSLGCLEKKSQAIEALHQLKNMVDGTIDLSKYLSIYVIAILEKIARFTNAKKIKRPDPEPPYALSSLEEIMKLLGSNVQNHATYLVKVFYSVSEINNMEMEALSLWNCFIFALSDEGLKLHLSTIIRGLTDMICHSNQSVRILVADTIKKLLIDRYELTKDLYGQIPPLPQFDELQDVREFIESSREMQLIREFNRAFASIQKPSDVEILLGIQKMSKLLERKELLAVRTGHLYSQLLMLAHKYINHPEISYAVGVCLGKLNAIDPSRIQVKVRNDKTYVINNFKTNEENLKFICDIVINCLIPAYHAVNNEFMHQLISYSIQVLLKHAGFRTVETMESSKEYEKVFNTWQRFPHSIQEFLTPLLRSSYVVVLPEYIFNYPIYTKADSVSTWVVQWYCLLEKITDDEARPIFSACLPVVYYGNLDVALYLLPHLILHVILSASASDIQNIVNEILLVLNTNSKLDKADQKNQASLQAVVAITEHCRQWLYRAGSRDTTMVGRFLEAIPDKLMAKASFYAKAYPQALMHFENYIKTSSSNLLEDEETMRFLRHIYVKTENMQDLQALLSMYSIRFSNDEEIIRFENMGKWKEAEIYHMDNVAKNPHDLSACMSFLECLKKSGSYASILYFSDKYVDANPHWSTHMNAFKMDAAWRMGDWNALDEASKHQTIETTESFIARALGSMKKNRNLEAASYIEHARRDLISSLGAKTIESYQKSYQTIFKLQQLQELEDAQKAWEAKDPIEKVSELENKWNRTLKLLMPQYQHIHDLLELRRTALYDIRPRQQSVSCGGIWLDIAKYSRKNGHLIVALDAIVNAERAGNEITHREKAKWLWQTGRRQDAVTMLTNLEEGAAANDAIILNSFYLKDSSIYSGEKARFYMTHARKGPEKQEKANVQYAVYLCKQCAGRPPSICIRVYEIIIKTVLKALSCGSKYYYTSMSKFINYWVKMVSLADENKKSSEGQGYAETLTRTNELIRTALTKVPTYQFGKFLTRLISHLTVGNTDMANTLSCIIEAVFSTYPRNTIWLLLNTLDEVMPEVDVMRSLQQPKRITFVGSDGRNYKFLCKANDDLRKDARMMEFNYMINSFLKKNPDSRDRNLYIRTYAVIPLGDEWGLIEWIDNLFPLKAIATDIYNNLGIKANQVQIEYRNKRQLPGLTDEELLELFKRVLAQSPPVLHKWFLKSFPEPNQWLASRTRYVKTLAVMSIVGHMLGLGDRHAENILFDRTNGDTVHVDLNMLFDQGLRLNVPEVVPFRLTHNLVDAMGIVGYEGQFRKTCEIVLQILLNNRQALTGVFQTLFNEWSQSDARDRASRTMGVLKKKYATAEESGVEAEVDKLIKAATDIGNLSKMFPGWAAFI
ncbi:hypothetical protein BCV72DRAFT_251923 [Rhizopus microsporus var. microsporus]|uniref:Serine/threonine-protein kinase ATR n=1 Tax=Rhizopus microsporus var. microsporus TaxID=86635 RepID=A0A1X0QUE1_RHIZD|nr:hypothetical protein BCV72DRAFT_251923 [Rhizopus microsporus var. microsporus]